MSLPLRVVIAEPNPGDLELLAEHVRSCEHMTVLATCAVSQEAEQRARESHLLITNVELGDREAFDLIEAIRSDDWPHVIVVAETREYAARAFDAGAIDYLTKPIVRSRVCSALDRVYRLVAAHQSGPAAELASALSRRRRRYAERIAIKHRGRVAFIRTSDIDWIESAGNYVCIHASGTSRLHRSKLSEIEKMLDPGSFVRVHRSRIVNARRVAELVPGRSGDCTLVLVDGTRITSSRTYRNQRNRILGLLDD